MRLYRISFVAGFAAGFVAGSRAGREKYDQLVRLAKTTAEHPVVQQAAGTLQAQASTAAQKVGGQLHDRVPQLAQTAAHSIGGHIPGLKHRNGSGNGAQGAGDDGPFASASDGYADPADEAQK